MIAHGRAATLIARLLFALTCKRPREFESHRHTLHTGLGMRLYLRSVRYGAWGGAKVCAWCTPESEARLKCATGALWGECRGGFLRLVHPIPRRGAPGDNSRSTQPHAAHHAQISVRPPPMHCTSREISPRPQPQSAPCEKLRPAPHKRSLQPEETTATRSHGRRHMRLSGAPYQSKAFAMSQAHTRSAAESWGVGCRLQMTSWSPWK